ncbi:ATP synthase F1 subunit epsilon [Clostridium ganghwense]|uniref:ATP synthase epsilon chain n=1 Tax=Clostridium ganghwense TaxID=312089 RepID=A0ABT4CL88_9CLOT|nr:ATP synthase F1 subunit epsilon [Clostridium ganghwense]MCY6369814.1 ATP synthase F1 subunit epsilon [Clostridium ganghwense]
MAEFMNLKIITADREFHHEEIVQLNTESVEGQIGILPKHVPSIVALKPTISQFINTKKEKKEFFSSSGVLKVTRDEIIMLCDACEWPEEIDVQRAKRSKERAEKRLKQDKDIDIDIERAKMSLMRALMRIKMKEM